MSNPERHMREPQLRPRLILLGPPGAGKSTVAEHLVQRLPLTLIATGARLRARAASNSPSSTQIRACLARGQLIPDDLMRQLVRDWLASVPPERGFVLDGYPRSLNQAYDCERILADLQLRLDLAIGLVLARQEIFRRLAGRRICAGGGGEAFSLHLDDAAAVRRCQERGGQLIQRDDDRPEVIEEQLRVYEHETRPVLEFYARRGLLRMLDGDGASEDVAGRAVSLVEAALKSA